MKFALSKLHKVITGDSLSEAIKQLSLEVLDSVSNTRNLVLAGISPNGAHLANHFRLEIEKIVSHSIYSIDLNRNFSNSREFESNHTIQSESLSILNNKNLELLFIDDLIITGKSAFNAFKSIKDQQIIKRVLLLTIINQVNERFFPIHPDFCFCCQTSQPRNKYLFFYDESVHEEGFYIVER